MSGFGQPQLQAAVYQRLTGDGALMSSISSVYDFVPAFPAYPYVTIGETTWNDASNLETVCAACVLTFHVYSRQSGRLEAASIMERLHDLLHDSALTVSGYTLVFMRFQSGSIALEGDGVTYHGTMGFNALLQAE